MASWWGGVCVQTKGERRANRHPVSPGRTAPVGLRADPLQNPPPPQCRKIVDRTAPPCGYTRRKPPILAFVKIRPQNTLVSLTVFSHRLPPPGGRRGNYGSQVRLRVAGFRAKSCALDTKPRSPPNLCGRTTLKKFVKGQERLNPNFDDLDPARSRP